MEGFVRQPCVLKIRMLTTCCEACGVVFEVRYVPHELQKAASKKSLTYREAEKRLTEWEEEHPEKCLKAPVLLLT